MKIIRILLGVVLITTLVFTIYKTLNKRTNSSLVINNQVYTDSEPSVLKKTKNSITIVWQSQEKEIGSIEYGIMRDIYYSSRTDIQATNKHEIRIDFLHECTKYYYHISSESMIFDNENSDFTTLCDNAKMTNELNKTKKI